MKGHMTHTINIRTENVCVTALACFLTATSDKIVLTHIVTEVRRHEHHCLTESSLCNELFLFKLFLCLDYSDVSQVGTSQWVPHLIPDAWLHVGRK